MSTFQLVFTSIFVVFIIFGVIAFSLFTTKNNSVGPVLIWGTVDKIAMDKVISALIQQDKAFLEVSYVQKSPDTYITDVINGMASGSGPDIVMLTQDQIGTFSNKVDTISYGVISQSSFVSSYIPESQLFANQDGIQAVPFLIDPLVMYSNIDLLTSAGVPTPPAYWEDLLTQAGRITVLDSSNNIKKSAIALGGWDNIANAKAILSALFMQAGDMIVTRSTTGAPMVVFGTTPAGAPENPATSALQFYTEFSNPSKVTYSWNRSLPNSSDAFASGDVALYLGLASDYPTLRARNPNLRMGVSLIPQIKGSSTRLTFGNLTALAIPRTVNNPNGALAIVQKLGAPAGIAAAVQAFGLPPVRLDVPQDTSGSAANAVFYQSALMSRGWVDPDGVSTSDIFKTMISDVISNRSLPNTAVQNAAQSLEALVPQNTQ